MERLEAVPQDEAYDSPDWEATRDELRCPLCEYNLRGLREPRCPECGYRFAWRDLTDPSRRKHPYLFEHHPKRNYWSFRETARGGLRPVKFWASLHPTQPSRPGRLVLYWGLAMLIALAGAATPYAVEWGRRDLASRQRVSPAYLYAYTQGHRGRMVYTAPPPPPPTLDGVLRTVGTGYLAWWAWGCLWPWLTFLTLMIFRVSMSRARIKTVHVLRCVLYSSDTLLWAGIALLLLSAAAAGVADDPAPWRDPVATWLLSAVALWIAVRLGLAYQTYLRFDRPWATVIASQVIVGLVALVLMESLWGTATRLVYALHLY